MQDAGRTNDIYLIASAGEDKQARKVTFDSYDDRNLRFAAEGRKLCFIRSDATGGGGGGGFGNASVQIYSVGLERLDRDPDDPEDQAAPATPDDAGEGAPPPRRPMNRPPQETKADWAGLKHGTRQVTRMPFRISSYAVAPDSRTVVFVTSEPAGIASTPVIYSIQEDGKRLTRVAAGGPPAADEGGGGGGGFGGGISGLGISRDGRTLFFFQRNGIHFTPLQSVAPATAAATPGRGPAEGADDGRGRRI